MTLPLTDFVFRVVFAAFLLVPLLASISRFRHWRAERRALARRMICRLCLHAFEDRSHLPSVPCPLCGAANEKGRSRTLG
jgi:prepilin signal peptidase PulO-like enzyme (type II secretory pathway)